MALGVSDEIIVSYVQQPARVVWLEDQPQHPNVEIVFSEDVAVGEVAHVDAFAIDTPRHLEAYERWQAVQRISETIEISILEGGVGETVFIDKYDCHWRIAIATLWQPILAWRGRDHVTAFVADEAYVVETLLSWYIGDGARHLQAFENEQTAAWLVAMAQNAHVYAPTQAIAVSTVGLGDVHYTGGRMRL